jgi:hypothetical protein
VFTNSTDGHLIFSAVTVADEVTDVCNIDDTAYTIPSCAKHARKSIREYIGTKITDMRGTIDGWSTGIEKYEPWSL